MSEFAVLMSNAELQEAIQVTKSNIWYTDNQPEIHQRFVSHLDALLALQKHRASICNYSGEVNHD